MINAVYTRIYDITQMDTNVAPGDSDVDGIMSTRSTGKATFATLLTCDYAYGYTLRWHTQTSVALMNIPDKVLQFASHQFGSNVRLCTELRYKATTYRCH